MPPFDKSPILQATENRYRVRGAAEKLSAHFGHRGATAQFDQLDLGVRAANHLRQLEVDESMPYLGVVAKTRKFGIAADVSGLGVVASTRKLGATAVMPQFNAAARTAEVIKAAGPLTARFAASGQPLGKAFGHIYGEPMRSYRQTLVDQVSPSVFGALKGKENPFLKSVRPEIPITKGMIGAVRGHVSVRPLNEQANDMARSLTRSLAPVYAKPMAGRETFDLQTGPQGVFGPRGASLVADAMATRGIVHSPAHPRYRTDSPVLAELRAAMPPSPLTPQVYEAPPPPAWPPQVVEHSEAEVAEVSEPRTLVEVTAQVEARVHLQAAEALLETIGLSLELELLRRIPVLLRANTEPDHLYAALSASIVLKGLANAIFPARRQKWPGRFGGHFDVGGNKVANRISAFVDWRLRAQLSTQDHKLFQATIDFVSNWSGEGHHKAHTPEQAIRAYRHLLCVLAHVARAHGQSSRDC